MAAAIARILGLMMALLVREGVAADGVLYVDDDAPLGGNGSSWKSAYRFLQDALAEARQPGSDVSEIRVAQGAYRPDQDEKNPQGTLDQTATFALVDTVAVRGGYAGIGALDPDARDIQQFETVLTGQIHSQCLTGTAANIDHIVSSFDNSVETMLDGVSMQCGQASFPGGSALYVVGGGLTILNCTFKDNSADASDGGAAHLTDSTVAFFGSVFTHNSSLFADTSGIHSIQSNVTVVQCDFIENVDHVAMRNTAGTHAVLIGCTFADAYSGTGASTGIWNFDSTVIVSNCAFLNSDEEGTGAMGNVTSVVDVSKSVFDNNLGDVSGAIYNSASTVSVRDSLFMSNVGDEPGSGGAIYSANSDIAIASCRFHANHANDFGGAIRNQNTDARIVNCEFISNSAEFGGAIANNSSSPTLVNCTFSHNRNVPLFHPPSAAMYSDADSAPTLINCIVWNHDDAPFGGPGDVAFAYCNIGEGAPRGPGNISSDPLFVATPNPGRDQMWHTADDDFGNLRLLPGSPCIDAGDNTAVPADEFDLDADGDTTEPIPFDLAGLPRFVDDPQTVDTGTGSPPIVDMGAYEFTGTINPLDLTGDGVVDAADLAQLLSDWGACPGCPSDLTGDSIVNAGDLAELLANWG